MTRRTIKIRNAFHNDMLTDIKLSKDRISKIIQSGGAFGFWFAFLGKNALTNVVIYLTRDNLPGLVDKLTSKSINKFERKTSGKGAVRAGKGFILFISNADIIDDVQIIKLLEDFGILIDGVLNYVNIK